LIVALASGEVIDRYLLQEHLGSGSFGEVWRASQLADGKQVGISCAIKLMKLTEHRAGPNSRTFATGWLDEVRSLVSVGGDALPRILEADVWNGYAYIAMELLGGTTLGWRLRQAAIPWRRALFIADRIAGALEAAHHIGIVHRDLKPQNIMLVEPTRVCVIDWGIARLRNSTPWEPSGVGRRATNDVEATDDRPVAPIASSHLPRAIGGTPGYRAPEIYPGAHPAPEQDVYALGVVLYEMIAGELPHAVKAQSYDWNDAESMTSFREALDQATMDGALVPLSERCPGTPRAITELVDRLLAREPQHRPQHPRAEIQQVIRFPQGVPARPYVGLSSMGLEHAGLYFGQDDTIHHVVERLRTQTAVLLWGPSGSGKSSLALAGVAATMDRTLFLDTDGWDVHLIRPRDGLGVRVVPDARPWQRQAIGQVIVIDQLEEVVDLEPCARDMFCAAVLALMERTSPVLVGGTVIGVTEEIRVIATVRDDLEGRIHREVAALRPLLERRIIVKGVDANLARKIIEEPAHALGYAVEGIEEVSREVEEQLSFEPAKLPVVQYALSEWWERRAEAGAVLPVAVWNELGGVNGALSSVAERLFAGLELAQQLRLKALLLRLFHGGRKQPVPESVLGAEDRQMMEELQRLRLVNRRDKDGGAPFYEVEHESLSVHWRRLGGWLSEALIDQALADDLERDAGLYERDLSPELLWKQGRLAAAGEVAGRGRIMFSPTAARFLRDSRRRVRNSNVAAVSLIGIGLILVTTIVWIVSRMTDEAQRSDQMAVSMRYDQRQLKAYEEASTRKDAEISDLRAELQRRVTSLTSARAEAERRSTQCAAQLKTTSDQLAATAQQADNAWESAHTARRYMEVSEQRATRADVRKMEVEGELQKARDKAWEVDTKLRQTIGELNRCRERAPGR
jgi:serine/threonine protein kinase